MDDKGCEWQQTIALPDGLPLGVMLGNDRSITLGDTTQLHAVLNNFAAVTYAWSPTGGLSCARCKDPKVSPLQTTTYTVTVTDANNCTATDEIVITVLGEQEVYIPNTFTPNGDGINDGFTAYGGKAADRITIMRIFDRWGELVYEGKDLPLNIAKQGWDGKLKADALNNAVFVYYLEIAFVDGTTKQYKGDITLVK